MVEVSLRYFLILLFYALTQPALLAQSLLESEDFAQGLPALWSTADLNGTSAVWEYCPEYDEFNLSCPKIWESNGQSPFASTSADNGYMNFDSDRFSNQYTGLTHDVHLTSGVFDFSEEDQVWLKFEFHIGVYQNPTTDNAIVEVSTDGENWTLFNFASIIPGNSISPGFVRWSENPTVAILDLSAIAAGSSTVQIRWRWASKDEFYFAVDDIAIYDGDPTLFFVDPIDMGMLDFYAIAPNYLTPESQIEPIHFLGDFANYGHETADNVVFKISLSHLGDTIHTDSVNFANISGSTLIENTIFPNASPQVEGTGVYTGSYSICSQSEETNSSNDSKDFQFRITDTLFAKAFDNDNHLQPSANAWNSPQHNWAWGNYFYMPNGAGQFAKGMSFSVAPAEDQEVTDLAGLVLNILLYTWKDENGNAIVEENERDLKGGGDYIMSGFENPMNYIYVPFQEEVALEDTTGYIAMLSFVATETVTDLRMGASGDLDYGGMILATRLAEQPRYASVLFINTPGNLDFSTLGFDYSITSTVRLHLKKMPSNTRDSETTSNALDIYPNPNQGNFWLRCSLPKDGQRVLRVYDVLGNLHWQAPLDNCDQCPIDLSHLAPALYFVQVASPYGHAIKPVNLFAE